MTTRYLMNAWLPPPVAEQTKREAAAFASVVRSVQDSWRPDDPDSIFSTLKWISVIDMFLKAKSEINIPDVETLTMVGLELFEAAQNKLYAQVRWGSILIRLLKMNGKKIPVKVKWRPLYDSLIIAHFKRNTGPEGWRLRQQHFETVTALVQSCRKYFPAGSASEIWSEFGCLLENPWHNVSFEGCGFLQLFLPMNMQNEDFFTTDWIKECIKQWEFVPNCLFWDVQWASIIARCIKNFKGLDWEPFLPTLFTKYLNIFEVPVPTGNGSYPFPLDVPRSMAFLFSKRLGTSSKAVSVSIVHLLRPGSSALEHFKKFADLLEQFYHPSNGGRWTSSLERLLRYLVITFQKRLQCELKAEDNTRAEYFLGKAERLSFVRVILTLIDRGQYSKNEPLSETVAVAMSILSYVEPSLILPFITSRFNMALETLTATHQLTTAITSVSYSSRAVFFATMCSSSSDVLANAPALNDLLMVSLSNALFGMDANDPPKTLATMQLIASVFSNLAGISEEGPAVLQFSSFADWLDEFFSRLFALLLHLEPRSVLHEDAFHSSSSGTFLVEDNPYFYVMLEVVLGRLSKPLYLQSLKKISKFVNTNILPGAIAEVGLLCCACVSVNPELAAHHLIEPILESIASSLQETPVSGYGGNGILTASFSPKAAISPALETSLAYQFKVLSVAISYAGPALLPHKEKLKVAISSAFEVPSWKVNGAGDTILRSLLGSLVLFYPRNQYECFSCHLDCPALEEWLKYKVGPNEAIQHVPEWHIPSEDELAFANELLSIHFRSALNDLLIICGSNLHSETGNEKDHLKVTMLRIFSSLQGVLSCLPELRPSSKSGRSIDLDRDYFFIAGSCGLTVGSSEMREEAAQNIHDACRYLLNERSDDSILLLLLIHIMDALANIGSLENEELTNQMQAWKLESAAIIEPSCNYIVPTKVGGKKRPRWALIDKAYMHNTWRSSRSFHHKFRTDSDLSPPDGLILIAEDLLKLSLHRYETVRTVGSRSLVRILKRWSQLISKVVVELTAKLLDPSTEEHEVLGSCAVLGCQTILRHLAKDVHALSSFLLGLLSCSHHESLKAQKAITELFVKYNINFSGVPGALRGSSNHPSDVLEFTNLVSQIRAISFDSRGLHWRYDLMANRVFLLLMLASRRDSNISPEILDETTGHFLENLNSQLPQSRMLAVSALNALLTGSHDKIIREQCKSTTLSRAQTNLDNGGSFREKLQEGFFSQALASLSHVHIISDVDGASKRHHGSSLQTASDKAITLFYFDFSASWPRTPSWISLLGSHTFYSSFARIFKRLAQECGPRIILSLKSTLEELVNSTEISKQCVAAEAMAGILHSDIDGLTEAWDNWILFQVQKIIMSQSMESMPEWAACIRYAATGKGKYGSRAPVLRNRILDSLLRPLPKATATNIMTKRYAFIVAAFAEIYPMKMSSEELEYHNILMNELLGNMNHSSAQVREAMGVALAILCSNLRVFRSSGHTIADEEIAVKVDSSGRESWVQILLDNASEHAMKIQNSVHIGNLYSSTDSIDDDSGFRYEEVRKDINRMETMLHFIISSFKSGRSSTLLDVIVGYLYPIIALQETVHKELSTLAKAAFELLKWRILPRPHVQKTLSVLSISASDSNWRTRNSSLSYLRVFMYRHVFILSDAEKQQVWMIVEKLLADSQVEVREQAAGVLAGLIKAGDELTVSSFREQALAGAEELNRRRKQRNWNSVRSIASAHGTVLALAATVLSVPYDMPRWLPAHVTLLARFMDEPSPIKSTVIKAVAEFRRTHADTWIIQKDSFTEEQLEVLADTSSSASYFA